MIEVDNFGINYFTLSFIMPCMGNLNANLGVKPLSSMMRWIIYKKYYWIGLVIFNSYGGLNFSIQASLITAQIMVP
jgi:hypothetical protein